MKKFMMGVVAAMAMGVMAETANTVKVTKFHQSYPYSGKATVEYTVGGTLPANAVAEITINTDDASATFTQSNIVTGANSYVIDFASSFGGALLLTNASFVVTIAEGAGGGGSSGGSGGVQLWEGGPYWAECNVGASKPEDYGYYFWWGDTVGYKRENDKWVATDGSPSNFSFSSGNTPTYGKGIATLQSEGWITADGVLAPAHDAARVHWGGEWRMPTDAEISALIDNCTTTWITTNGVQGYLVTGKGGYTSACIFLPCAGDGLGTSLENASSYGNYWSSVPNSSYSALFLNFYSSGLSTISHYRYYGRSVRPVRATPATMVTITFNANGGTVSPSSQSYAANGTYDSLPTPTYTGYTFAGWYTEATGGTQVTSSSLVPASGITLYAHWTANDPGTGDLGGVQLWEGGPYWAECNVGATKPEDYGYYFWWGDMVGYTNTGSGWISVKDGTSISFSSSDGTAASTYAKDNSALQSAGYIDSTGNLVAAHDAATAHLGAPWRMPTSAEIQALVDNCTTTWITTNGVSGRLVTGKGSYANRSIFLPAAGNGSDSSLGDLGSYGRFWSSTPYSDSSYNAWGLHFNSSFFSRDRHSRFYGRSVRPVRATPATMVTITFNANGGTVSPSSQSYTANGTYNSLPTPTYTGYTFAGWYTEATGGTQVTSSSLVPASGITLYAHWTANDPGTGDLGGVQLWEGGPYWAECNVGATKPEEYGYYFWWGDTVGYTRRGGTWTQDWYYSGMTWVSSTGHQMGSSPFTEESCPTISKDNSALQSAGYIDSTGNLVAAYDAATAHLGAPWRMPTDAEISALINKCTTTWITTNGVSGRLVTGKGEYANRCIFLPAAGFGADGLCYPGSRGSYWSSTPDPSGTALGLNFKSSSFDRSYFARFFGLSVRPVRGFAE